MSIKRERLSNGSCVRGTAGAGARNAQGCFIHSLPWRARSLVGETGSSETPEDMEELGWLTAESRGRGVSGLGSREGPVPGSLTLDGLEDSGTSFQAGGWFSGFWVIRCLERQQIREGPMRVCAVSGLWAGIQLRLVFIYFLILTGGHALER